jgi:hypothetical protein
MTVFDGLDQLASSLVGDEFGSPVIWHPRAALPSIYTGGDDKPDPARPDGISLTAIVTWKPLTETAGVTDGLPGGNRGGASTFEVSIDFATEDFEDLTQPGTFNLPRVGDIIELTDEYEQNKYVELKRICDDGSMRAICYGTAVSTLGV